MNKTISFKLNGPKQILLIRVKQKRKSFYPRVFRKREREKELKLRFYFNTNEMTKRVNLIVVTLSAVSFLDVLFFKWNRF